MTDTQRHKLLDYNENLCQQYNETEDASLLEKIAVTEVLLFNDPVDHRKDLQEEKDWRDDDDRSETTKDYYD